MPGENVQHAAATSRPPSAPAGSRRGRILFAVVVFAALAGAAVLYTFNPVGSGFYPPCPFRAATGLHCPGCGSTRGLHALLHGRVWAAFRFNPLMVAALPFLLAAFVRHTRRVFGWERPDARPRRILPAAWIWALFVLVMAYWVLRNLPFRPFNWLAPTDVAARPAESKAG